MCHKCIEINGKKRFVNISYINKEKQESRNGVKNHTFPANQIFHEQLCISTIMNFQWYHHNSFKNCLMNIPISLVKF